MSFIIGFILSKNKSAAPTRPDSEFRWSSCQAWRYGLKSIVDVRVSVLCDACVSALYSFVALMDYVIHSELKRG